jgi:hypothetical protein
MSGRHPKRAGERSVVTLDWRRGIDVLIARIVTDTGCAHCRAVVVRIALDPRPD